MTCINGSSTRGYAREGADGSICNYGKDDVGVGDNDDHDHRGDRRVQEEMQEWQRMDLVEMMHTHSNCADAGKPIDIDIV